MSSCCFEFFKTFSVFIVVIQLVFGVFPWLYKNVVGPKFLEASNLRQYGNWALVTGATDGIGKQFARSLAQRGFNIVLVSRTLSKLESVAKELSENFNVQTHTIAVDFLSGPEIYDQIKQQILGKEIGVLINNVGMSHAAPDYFLNIPDREKVIQDIIKCNVTSVPMMCSVILPQMVQRKNGLIVNIASVVAVIPGPCCALYAASKAFITKFSNDLGAEYGYQGINVQVLVTGGVETKMNKTRETTGDDRYTTPTASVYVESALRYVGYARQTTGYLPHSLMEISAQLMTFIAPSFTVGLFKKLMLSLRDKEIQNGSYTSAK
ncbi:very-long-chain 3-oxoacyl-CoA reductase-B-like [Bradysia coprophila]|uniref:very-long-chain 3-oxoacyl-CoA reductase-B-like n=1 Tax=Bradysia coprophila TaxID=38358 RepID=UPI00187DD715|nr:very-long-chain 3-oxoacyl-CoA reductase-B-like [Bradysia coprophila]